MSDPRYPIGQHTFDPHVTAETRRTCIRQIADAPSALRAAVARLDDRQLERPYRTGGWTIRQVVHHVPESHMNAFIRFKLALTETNPTIKPYDEAAWSVVADTARTPIETSLRLLEALHERWVILLESMRAEDFSRPLHHPDRGPMTLDMMLQLYAWHGRHHVAHVLSVDRSQ